MKSLPENILRCIRPEDRLWPDAGRLAPSLISTRQWERDEISLQGLVAKYLTFLQTPYAWQNPAKKTTGRPGTPDFIFPWHGRYCAVECKVGNATCTKRQIEFLDLARRRDGAVIIARSLDDVVEMLHAVEAATNPNP